MHTQQTCEELKKDVVLELLRCKGTDVSAADIVAEAKTIVNYILNSTKVMDNDGNIVK